jgi:hypothetical protein
LVLACPPVRTAMVDRRVHHPAFGVVYGVSERPFWGGSEAGVLRAGGPAGTTEFFAKISPLF